MTFYTLLRLHKHIKSRRLKLLGLFVASHLGLRHLSIRIDPVLGCNLACRMCNYSSPEHRRSHTGTLTTEEFEDIARALFPRAFQLIVGCGAEPTKHPRSSENFSGWHSNIRFRTWGSCSFSKFRRADHWNRRLWKSFFSKRGDGKWLSRSLMYEEVKGRGEALDHFSRIITFFNHFSWQIIDFHVHL